MKRNKTKRRLFDILTKEVSIVDFPANQHKFLIIKNQEVKTVEELQEILKNIEKALTKLGENDKLILESITEPDEQEIDLEKLFGIKLDKAGAKYSKSALSQLRSIRSAIDQLLSGSEDKDKEPASKQEVSDSFTKSFTKALGIEEEGKDTKLSEDTIKAIGEVIAQAVETHQKQKEANNK